MLVSIEKIVKEEATAIIETQERRGLFWYEDNLRFVAIDNSTGDAWVEAFSTLGTCKKWLRRA